MGPPKVLGLPNPASSISTSSTFGAPAGAPGWRIRFQSGCDPRRVRLAVPSNDGAASGSTVRSGSGVPCLGARDLGVVMLDLRGVGHPVSELRSGGTDYAGGYGYPASDL